MAVPTPGLLLYGAETWVLRQDLNKIQSAQIKFLRSVKCCTILDKIRNEEVVEN